MNKEYTFQGNTFVIENYGKKPAFTDFLPGIAGLSGRPLWAFYINRGQGIAGFGVRGKDTPIMEFFPAEIAYANAPRQGFRTFLRINGKYCEPLAVNTERYTAMSIRRFGFSLEEQTDEYRFRAEYFGVPEESYAALARVVTYKNTTSSTQEVEILDGLAQILPRGITNSEFKQVGNLFKSWMCVGGTQSGYAFYKMRSSTADSSEVNEVRDGNFFLSACDRGDLHVVVDPKIVFGEDQTKTTAQVFAQNGIKEEILQAQNTENEFACAFAHGKFLLEAGETVTFAELFGYADSESRVQRLHCTLSVEKALNMRARAEQIAEQIADLASSQTAYPLFDEYIRQSYFDNVLRGGMPVMFGEKAYYVYSRKHGDPERDYNSFVIEPQPYSCGGGNFRDVAQNRRNDIFFTPECGDFNIQYFFSLLQLDGYNPLSVVGVKYRFVGEIPKRYKPHEAFLRGEFTVGELCGEIGTTDKTQIAAVLEDCEALYQAKFAEGYWTDHFVYLIDLITSYLAVYPDRVEELLFKTPYRWFVSGAKVLPRDEKTLLRKDGAVRRYGSVVENGTDGWATTKSGKYLETSLAAKLLHLIAMKLATLDPLGCGIDMEADKPGWCDATNGLPSVFGSNVADAIELKRLVRTFMRLINGSDGGVEWSREQDDFFGQLFGLLQAHPSAEKYYEESNDIKERFREKAYGTFGDERAFVGKDKILAFLRLAEKRLDDGLQRAKDLGGGWYPTYLRFEVTDYEEIMENGAAKISHYGLPCVKAKAFRAYALPHFSESVAKGLTVGETSLYAAARNSQLYDGVLGLYRSSEPLDGESMEIGRIRSFPKGWLERESCFLHMNYKLMLSLLSAGLYDEFFEEIKTNFVPFMPPERYGRSTLENSSFLATSNHPDKGKWGRGFQARLTGANAEVLSMWRILMGAKQPFTMENGELKFALNPILRKDFFLDGKVSFLFLGKTKIIYHNINNRNTYEKGVQIARYRLSGGGREETVKEVKGALATAVRLGEITKIEVDIE